MDSFSDYIWIIFIIISILSSLLSSNKKKQEQKRRAEAEAGGKPRESSRLEDTIRDIFGEQREKEPEMAPAPPSRKERRDINYDTWDPASEFKDYKEDINTNSILEQQKALQEKVTRIVSRTKSVVDTSSNILNSAPKPVSYSVRDSYRKRRIVNMLKSPDNIKDLIIAQELLNEPKAFRD